ncbi:MAG: YceI family protein [Chitinophagales bacterium]|nr:YceI family protein [Chitinophagales bacterium]MDW8419604.1 YceI family protein [Chitinophagales bacterium]
MKRLFTGLTFLAILASCNQQPASNQENNTAENNAPEVTYTLVTDSMSVIKWRGEVLGVKEHYGTVNFKEGTITVKGNTLAGGSFVADLTTIKPTDSNYDVKQGHTPEKLVAHLSSPDFFDVKNYPTATFKIDSVSGNTATGTLTIRGKSNTETLTDVVITEAENGIKASGKLNFDRKKYDVSFDMPVKDMVLSNNISLTIELTAKK